MDVIAKTLCTRFRNGHSGWRKIFAAVFQVKRTNAFSSLDCYMTNDVRPTDYFEGKLNKGVGGEPWRKMRFWNSYNPSRKTQSSYLFENTWIRMKVRTLASQIGVVSQAVNFSYLNGLWRQPRIQNFNDTGRSKREIFKHLLTSTFFRKGQFFYYPFGKNIFQFVLFSIVFNSKLP